MFDLYSGYETLSLYFVKAWTIVVESGKFFEYFEFMHPQTSLKNSFSSWFIRWLRNFTCRESSCRKTLKWVIKGISKESILNSEVQIAHAFTIGSVCGFWDACAQNINRNIQVLRCNKAVMVWVVLSLYSSVHRFVESIVYNIRSFIIYLNELWLVFFWNILLYFRFFYTALDFLWL